MTSTELIMLLPKQAGKYNVALPLQGNLYTNIYKMKVVSANLEHGHHKVCTKTCAV